MSNELDSPEVAAKMAQLEEKLTEVAPAAQAVEQGNFHPTPDQNLLVPDHLLHLYEKAKLEDLPDGTKGWVIEYDEFTTITGLWGHAGERYDDTPEGKKPSPRDGQWKGIGNLATELVNGPGQWTLINIHPNGSGLAAASFMRKSKSALPEPDVILPPSTTPPPSENEVAVFDEATKEWMNAAKA
jgi:hypothetical protein